MTLLLQTFEGTVKNALTITKLEREHTLGKLRCLANNNNITRPVESAVILKMLCKLLSRTPVVDFTNVSWAGFVHKDPQNTKKQ
jgi:hypothetical protein